MFSSFVLLLFLHRKYLHRTRENKIASQGTVPLGVCLFDVLGN